MMPDRALFAAGDALGFPRLPIRPAVSVIAGRAAWERFTANGTEEDVTAARIAVASRLAEKAQRRVLSVTPPSGQAEGSPGTAVTLAAPRCACCGAALLGRRAGTRTCGGRCRVADFRRGTRPARVPSLCDQAVQDGPP